MRKKSDTEEIESTDKNAYKKRAKGLWNGGKRYKKESNERERMFSKRIKLQ